MWKCTFWISVVHLEAKEMLKCLKEEYLTYRTKSVSGDLACTSINGGCFPIMIKGHPTHLPCPQLNMQPEKPNQITWQRGDREGATTIKFKAWSWTSWILSALYDAEDAGGNVRSWTPNISPHLLALGIKLILLSRTATLDDLSMRLEWK